MYLAKFDNMSVEELLEYIKEFRSDNIFAIAELIYHGVSVEKIHEITMITPYFLEAIKNIIDMEEQLRVLKDAEILTAAKKMGFSDKYIARLWKVAELDVYNMRKVFIPFLVVVKKGTSSRIDADVFHRHGGE